MNRQYVGYSDVSVIKPNSTNNYADKLIRILFENNFIF